MRNCRIYHFDNVGIVCPCLYLYQIRQVKERKITKLKDFENPAEIIEYYCKYFNSKPTDFEILL